MDEIHARTFPRNPAQEPMTYRDETYGLRILFQTRHYELTPAERAQMEENTHTLARAVESFPVADLHVEVLRHPRTQDFHVKTTLRLTKKALFTGDRDVLPHPAYERCVRKLVHKVQAYKEKMSGVSAGERVAEGARPGVRPDLEPDLGALERSAQAQDYPSFRKAISVYDDVMEHRVGRWIRRFPEAEARLGKDFVLADIVEEVCLNAYERFARRPADRLGNWLEKLIDPSLRAFLENGEAEVERARAAAEAAAPPRAVR
jgi:ribosome-associated translation inhibitor RaiA